MSRFATTPAGLGLEVRTGSAVVVIVRGSRPAPEIVLRHEIDLADAWVPESRHPHHQKLGDHGPAGTAACRRGRAAATTATRRAIRTLVGETKSHGLRLCGVAVVVARQRDPARVTGAHARAHAEEATLYREAVLAALDACGLRVATFVATELRTEAIRRLRRDAPAIAATLRAFSHRVGTPWRALEKQAALGAWLMLPATHRQSSIANTSSRE